MLTATGTCCRASTSGSATAWRRSIKKLVRPVCGLEAIQQATLRPSETSNPWMTRVPCGADDGIRTRDPHLGKSAEGMAVIWPNARMRTLTCGMTLASFCMSSRCFHVACDRCVTGRSPGAELDQSQWLAACQLSPSVLKLRRRPSAAVPKSASMQVRRGKESA
jgi:hypothetical protein